VLWEPLHQGKRKRKSRVLAALKQAWKRRTDRRVQTGKCDWRKRRIQENCAKRWGSEEGELLKRRTFKHVTLNAENATEFNVGNL